MKTLKVFLCLVLLQFVSLVVFESCILNCGDPIKNYTFADVEVRNNVSNRDNLESVYLLQSGFSIHKTPALNYLIGCNFGILVSTDMELHKNPFISSAKAYTCNEEFVTDLQMKSLRITTLNNFKEGYLVDTDISSFFQATADHHNIDSLKNIDEFISSYNNTIGKIGFGDSFHLKLNQTPTLDSIFRFEVTVDWENGDRLIDTTEQIILY